MICSMTKPIRLLRKENNYVAASKKLGYDSKIAVMTRGKRMFIVKKEALEKC